MMMLLRAEDENASGASLPVGSRAEKRTLMGYTPRGSGEARSRLFDIPNA